MNKPSQPGLISPYGGALTTPMEAHGKLKALKKRAMDLPGLDLNRRQMNELELLLTGGFSPLSSYMAQVEYDRVIKEECLLNGMFWPWPITLDIPAEMADALKTGDHLALRDPEGLLLAILTITDLWQADKKMEAWALYGTEDTQHPGVRELVLSRHPCYAGGTLQGVSFPVHHDFATLRQPPHKVREYFTHHGRQNVVAFPLAVPLHRPEHRFITHYLRKMNAGALITAMGSNQSILDSSYFARIHSYQVVLSRFPRNWSLLNIVPLHQDTFNARQTALNAIVLRNYGCNRMVTGREINPIPVSGPKNQPGSDTLSQLIHDNIGVELVSLSAPTGKQGVRGSLADGVADVSAEVGRRLEWGMGIPDKLSFPEVIEVLQKFHPPRSRQGFTVFFTGLSGAGKSTLARALMVKLLEVDDREVTLLDGDLVRKHLSSELGFSKEHRDINIRRIGYVASEITKHRGVALCAPIAPYRETRRVIRQMIEPLGGFFEIYISTPLEECERRDHKGLYARARAGLVKEFTGISDPYESPERAELSLDTSKRSVEQCMQIILQKIKDEGYLM